VESARFSPDGLRVVTSSDDCTARVWDAHTGQALSEPLKHGAAVLSAQFSPDGQRVVTASSDKTAQVWDARTGQALTLPLNDEERVWSVRFNPDVFYSEFSPDGQRVVTSSDDNTAQVWDVRTGQPLGEPLRHGDRVESARFSPDGLRVVTASSDKTAQVWDARTGQPLGKPLKHEAAVASAQFSPDGQRVVTVSSDNTAQVWDARTGQLLGEPFKHGAAVRFAEFSPDGEYLITHTPSDGTARLWHTPTFPSPIPGWLPRLAEAVAGQRLNDRGILEFVSGADFLKLRQELAVNKSGDRVTQWVQWFFADRATRTISPFSSITFPEYVRRRIEQNTVESLREAAELSPTNAVVCARLAMAIAAQSPSQDPRQLAEADCLSGRAVELDPQDLEVLRLRAVLLGSMGKIPEALVLVDQVIGSQPTNAEAWQSRGTLLEKANRLEEACQGYGKALELVGVGDTQAKTRNLVLLQRSNLLRRLNRRAESLADYEKLLETEFPTAEECNNLAWTYVAGPVSSQDPERAVLLARKAVRLSPKSSHYLNTLGVAYYRLGQFQEAVETLAEAGKANRDEPTAFDLFFLAMCFHQLGEPDRARNSYEKAMQWWKHSTQEISSQWNEELESFQAEAEKLLGIPEAR